MSVSEKYPISLKISCIIGKRIEMIYNDYFNIFRIVVCAFYA